jgi:hypothetical protein
MAGKVVFVGRKRNKMVGLEEQIECLWLWSLHWAFEGLLYAGNRSLGQALLLTALPDYLPLFSLQTTQLARPIVFDPF